MKVTAKRSNGKPVEAEYDFGDNLEAMVKKFGSALVFDHARGSLRVALQGFMRSQIDAEKTPEQIAEAVKNWQPGTRKPAKTPQERIREALAAMSPEDRAALVKEMAGAKKAAQA